ncbi:MAG: leucine-rich repeat protein [Bacteroidaceae bacterium]|nr:leucine-rich repeat protein [Bacteroidaceae bacterium]
MDGKEISKLVIPNGTDRIGAYVFDGCESLSSVVIPNTVKKIGENAFRNCTDLGSVTCLIKTPFILDESVFCCDGSYIYDTVYMLATLFVPRGRDNFYAQLDGWKKFSSIQTTETQFTISYIVDGEPYKVYEVQATDVVTPEPSPVKEGYIFSGWSDIPWYMPAEDVTVYGHFTIDPEYETGVENIISTESAERSYYTADGRKLPAPQKGINIIRYSDGTTKKVLVK